MAIDEIIELARSGHVEEAIIRINHLRDPLEQIKALTEVAGILHERGEDDWSIELIQDANYIVRHTKDPYVRSVGYSMVGFALSKLGYIEEGEEFFKSALDEVTKIGDVMKTGEALARIAGYIALTGAVDYALKLFDTALEIVVRAEADYIRKTEAMTTIAEIIEEAADRLYAPKAAKLYEMAFDIFEKLHVPQKAGTVEKKLMLSRIVRTAGFPEVRNALMEGRYRYALAMIGRLLSGEDRIVGILEEALWMKIGNNPSYLDVVNNILPQLERLNISQEGVKRIAHLLTKLGKLDGALRFAVKIEDEIEKSEALQRIALSLAEEGMFKEAEVVAMKIPDPTIREQTLREIKTIEPW